MKRGLLVLLSVAALSGLSGATVLNGLEVWLPLDGNLLDASGNGRDGVLVQGPSGTAAFVPAVHGQGLDLGLLDESLANVESQMTGGSHVAVTYTLPEAGTISVKYKTAPFYYNYQSIWDNSGTGPWPGDTWEAWLDSWQGGEIWARSPSVPPANWGDVDNRAVTTYLGPDYLDTWITYTVSWQRNGATMEMRQYIDGALTDVAPSMVWVDAGAEFYLGGGNDANTYGIGVWDDLGIWSRQLTEAEIVDLHRNGIPEPMTLALLGMGGLGLLRRRR